MKLILTDPIERKFIREYIMHYTRSNRTSKDISEKQVLRCFDQNTEFKLSFHEKYEQIILLHIENRNKILWSGNVGDIQSYIKRNYDIFRPDRLSIFKIPCIRMAFKTKDDVQTICKRLNKLFL